MSGLTGPFAIALVPIALWEVWRRLWSDTALRMALLRAGIVLACAALQGAIVVSHLGSRSHEPLGATPELFARILSSQVFIASLIGQHGLSWMQRQSILSSPALAGLITVVGLGLWALAFMKGSAVLRQATVLAALIFLAALATPQVSLTDPQWKLLAEPGVGCRYWVIPMLVWIGVLQMLAGRAGGTVPRAAAWGLILLLPIGITGDWTFHWTRTHFVAQARAFEAAPRGKHMILDARPTGWKLELTKQ